MFLLKLSFINYIWDHAVCSTTLTNSTWNHLICFHNYSTFSRSTRVVRSISKRLWRNNNNRTCPPPTSSTSRRCTSACTYSGWSGRATGSRTTTGSSGTSRCSWYWRRALVTWAASSLTRTCSTKLSGWLLTLFAFKAFCLNFVLVLNILNAIVLN